MCRSCAQSWRMRTIQPRCAWCAATCNHKQHFQATLQRGWQRGSTRACRRLTARHEGATASGRACLNELHTLGRSPALCPARCLPTRRPRMCCCAAACSTHPRWVGVFKATIVLASRRRCAACMHNRPFQHKCASPPNAGSRIAHIPQPAGLCCPPLADLSQQSAHPLHRRSGGGQGQLARLGGPHQQGDAQGGSTCLCAPS